MMEKSATVPQKVIVESLLQKYVTSALVLLNAAAMLFLAISTLVVFFTESSPNHLFKVYGLALPETYSPVLSDAVRASIIPATSGAAASKCYRGDRACDLGKLQYYTVGSPGMLRDHHYGEPADAFDTIHSLWTSSWFATPLALLLVGSTFNESFDTWFWWLLYALIFFWNCVGIIVQLVIKSVPLYNVYFALGNFVFSSLAVVALRDVERATEPGEATVFTKPAASFMRLARVEAQQFSAGSTEEPKMTFLKNSYSSSSVLVLQLFFLFPAFCGILFSLTQQRVTGIELQHIYWLSAFFISTIVLLQRCYALDFSDISCSSFLLLALSTGIGFMYRFIPNLSVALAAEQFQAMGAVWTVIILFVFLVLTLLFDTYLESMIEPVKTLDPYSNWSQVRKVLQNFLMTSGIITVIFWGVAGVEHRLSP